MSRLIINLSDAEYTALQASAEKDLRDLRGQARYLLIRALASDVARSVTEAPTHQPTQPKKAEAVYA